MRIKSDFRDDLISDPRNPNFASMRAGKRTHPRSVNSEDAATWNVRRSPREVARTVWLPELLSEAPQTNGLTHSEHATVAIRKTVAQPPSLVLDGDEGESGTDVSAEIPRKLWFTDTTPKQFQSGPVVHD